MITGLGAGGAERLVLDLMDLIDDQQFDVRLVSVVDNLQALEVYGHDGKHVNVFDLATKSRILAFWRMRKFVMDFAPDVIHAHMFHALLASIIIKKLIKLSPAICFTSHLNGYSFNRTLVVRSLKNARDTDIVFTRDQHPSINACSTAVIANGVHVASTPPIRSKWDPRQHVRLLAVGRLAQQKNPIGLLKTVATANLPSIHLDFVGVGPLEQDLHTLAEGLGLADRITFHGLRSDVRELMHNADIFVMHSEYEGMPMALLEAGAEAMPVLATPVGAIPEVLGIDRGWMAHPDRFATVLRSVVYDPAAAIEAGRKLHAYITRNHSIGLTVRKHEFLYATLYSSSQN